MALTGKPTKFYKVTTTSDVAIGGAATVTGNMTVTGTFTSSTTQGKANVKSNLKRVYACVALAPVTGAAADSTNYSGFIAFGRAGTVTKITVIADTPPAGGTDTLAVKKASSAGNTMLSASTYDMTSLVANTATSMTLTATAADLTLTAAQGIWLRYAAGVQTTDAINICVCVEFEPDDY